MHVSQIIQNFRGALCYNLGKIYVDSKLSLQLYSKPFPPQSLPPLSPFQCCTML